MGRYSFIGDPAALTSPITGAATRLVQVPSFAASTQMVAPIAAASLAAPVAAAAAPAAAAAAPGVGSAAGAIGAGLLSEVLADMLRGGVKAGTEIATGAFSPPSTDGGSGSKFMITLQDVKDIQQYVNNENFKRRALGMPPLDADAIIREREAQLRRSAAEAGAREYAIEQLRQQGAIQSALSQAVGQGTQSLGGVAQQSIASTLSRPDYGTIVSELGRAF